MHNDFRFMLCHSMGGITFLNITVTLGLEGEGLKTTLDLFTAASPNKAGRQRSRQRRGSPNFSDAEDKISIQVRWDL